MTRFLHVFRLWAFALIIAPLIMTQAAQAAPFAAYVMDARTGQPVYRQNADTRLHPASLTKMMTLYMAFHAVESGRVRLDSRFTISSNAANEPPSKLGLRAGQQIELRYLIRAAAVRSANDAATAIGEGLAGSEAAFTQQMTQMARAIGMNNTQFRNAHGLTAQGHFSTAHDMSILGRHLFYDFPQYYNLFSRRSADAGVAQVASTNRRFLDDYAGADGIKTGYTRAAGFNLTASAQRGNKRLIATVFGGTSTAQRNQVMSELLDASFPRIADRVREVRPNRPRLRAEAQTQTRRAQVQPTPAATQPEPQRMVLAASPAPAARPAAQASLVAAPAAAAAPIPDLTEALRQAGATADGQLARKSDLTLAVSSRPQARPGTPAATGAAIAEAVAEAITEPARATSASLAAPVISASPRPRPSPRRAQASTAGVVPEASAPAPASTAETAENTANPGSLTLDSSTAPRPRSETVILAAMGEGDRGNPESLEIVRRAAEGGRGWGISLGLFTSQAQAERELVTLSLQDGTGLAAARRNVADTRRGFDAQFHNLSRSQAQLACERLQSQTRRCEVIGR